MYMPNAKILRWGPNATYIPLEMGFALATQRKKFASPNARDTDMLVFFALGNAQLLSFVLGNAKLPDASSFASQWNIGLRLFTIFKISVNCMLTTIHRPVHMVRRECKSTDFKE